MNAAYIYSKHDESREQMSQNGSNQICQIASKPCNYECNREPFTGLQLVIFDELRAINN